ncbi:multidrug transporter [Paenibacillus marchantiophytorum]|uniref:Multidrug transporter n=1 Tax=Paenibacillus marchantiophytorum TaxID=1619310 RepID=A0ABQ1EVD6_9BACL|nr:DMT family transporter [Paenibacillus marchantiophytorum]GFZ87637.1 multidrug transporter [Paenibacillus marchantiophytorum]
MNAMNKTKVPIPVFLFIGIVAISFSAIFVRWSEAPAAVIAMYRLLMTNVLMLPFLWNYRVEIAKVRWRDWLKTAISGIALGLHFLFWMDSLRFTTVASSTAILTLEPIFVLLGAFLLYGQRTSRHALIAMCVAIVGAVCIGWGDFQFSGIALKGDMLSLIGTLAVALHMLLGKSIREHMSAFVYSFFVFLFAGLVLAVTNVYSGVSFTDYAPKEWGIFLLLAIVPTVFGHYVFNWLLKYMKASSVSMTVLGEPLGASILAYFILGETITTVQLLAGCLLLVGVGMFLRSNEKK